MIRYSAYIVVFVLSFGCDNTETQSRRSLTSSANVQTNAEADAKEEAKAEMPGAKIPGVVGSKFQLQVSWDESDDVSIISYRVSREDAGGLTLLKEWPVAELPMNGAPQVTLDLGQVLSAGFKDNKDNKDKLLCLVLSAVNEFGESTPTEKSCVDLVSVVGKI